MTLASDGDAGDFLRKVLRHQNLSARGSVYLDYLRGFSAVAVMIGHMRGLFFVSFGEVTTPNLAVAAIYFITSLGHQAVVVFFVLSGYFIAGTVLRSMAAGTWRWRDYLTRRFVRLYLVLIPALALGAFIDSCGIKLFGEYGIYGAHPDYRAIVPWIVADRVNIATLIGNALFLEEILVPTLGSNGPLWSLSYEFWFYIMFPCIMITLGYARGTTARIVYLGIFFAVAYFVGTVIFAYFFIWLVGALIVIAPATKVSTASRLALLAVAATGSLVMLASRGKVEVNGFVLDLVFSVFVAAGVYALANWPSNELPASSSRWVSTGRRFAGFSYTLYLVHMPILVFAEAVVLWTGGTRWQPTAMHLAFGAGLALIVLLYSWLLGSITEAHTARVTSSLLQAVVSRTTEHGSNPNR